MKWKSCRRSLSFLDFTGLSKCILKSPTITVGTSETAILLNNVCSSSKKGEVVCDAGRYRTYTWKGRTLLPAM